MAYIEGMNRNQAQMFPEYLDNYVDDNNPVRAIEAFIDSLDLKKLQFTKVNLRGPGAPSYNPSDLLKLYLYGYMNSLRSSRKLEKATYINIEVIWLIRKLHPDFKTIADFRKENKKQLKQIFKEFNLLCKDWSLFGGELVAVDGTKFRADNSKKNNYNKKKIDRQLKYIEDKSEEYLKALDEGDNQPDITPKYTVEQLKEKIEKLEKRKEFYNDLEHKIKNSEDNEISTTDPDARMMDNKKNGLEVSYNVQIAVDSKNKLILATEVTNKPSDQGHLNDMAQAAKETLGIGEKDTLEVTADKGYYQAEDLKKCEENGTVTYITHQTYSNATGNPEYYSEKFKYDSKEDIYTCPEGQKLYRTKHKAEVPEKILYKNYRSCKNCPNKDKCTKSSKGRIISRSIDQDFLDIVDARTLDNMDKYHQRQMIVEHPFGTVKRTMNAGYFLTRGLKSVEAEADLTFVVYNIKRVINILGVKEIVRRIEAKISLIYSKTKASCIFSYKTNLEKQITDFYIGQIGNLRDCV
jgi:transposase